jgi:hypothetical protein
VRGVDRRYGAVGGGRRGRVAHKLEGSTG